MFLDLVPTSHKRRTTDRLGRREIDYVAIPLLGKTAFLTTAPGTPNAARVQVEDQAWLVEKLLNLKLGRRRISYSDDFLPVVDAEAYEAFHKGSSRRCGHVHSTRAEAQGCSVATGLELDGDIPESPHPRLRPPPSRSLQPPSEKSGLQIRGRVSESRGAGPRHGG